MAVQSIDLRCKGCGAPVSPGDVTCCYCFRSVVISTFNSFFNMSLSDVKKCASGYSSALEKDGDNSELNSAVGMCYLRLKLYEKAFSAFERAIEDDFDNSETYFYAAVSLLKGEKHFLRNRDEIRQIIDYLNAAISIEDRGIYYYIMAYVKKDYFERKYLISNPKSSELLDIAKKKGYSPTDVQQVEEIMNLTIGL